MRENSIMWMCAAFFGILTIVLLAGKGGFLIAGYNTASKEKKKEYDEKKLCRVMGGAMGVITIWMAVMAIVDDPPVWLQFLFAATVAAVVIAVLVLSNTICKVKNPEQPSKSAREKRREKIYQNGTIIFVTSLFLVIGVVLITGEIQVTVQNEQIKIEGSYWKDMEVPLPDIKSVSYTEELETGRRTNGLGSFRLQEGKFKNGKFGSYTRYTYVKCSSYVILETDEQKIVVNAATREETKKLCERIEKACDS